MTSVTVHLSEGEIRALKARTGKKSPGRGAQGFGRPGESQALAVRTSGSAQAVLEGRIRGQRTAVSSGREAIRWLES